MPVDEEAAAGSDAEGPVILRWRRCGAVKSPGPPAEEPLVTRRREVGVVAVELATEASVD